MNVLTEIGSLQQTDMVDLGMIESFLISKISSKRCSRTGYETQSKLKWYPKYVLRRSSTHTNGHAFNRSAGNPKNHDRALLCFSTQEATRYPTRRMTGISHRVRRPSYASIGAGNVGYHPAQLSLGRLRLAVSSPPRASGTVAMTPRSILRTSTSSPIPRKMKRRA